MSEGLAIVLLVAFVVWIATLTFANHLAAKRYNDGFLDGWRAAKESGRPAMSETRP